MNTKFQIGDLVRFVHEDKTAADTLIRRIIAHNTLGVVVDVTSA